MLVKLKKAMVESLLYPLGFTKQQPRPRVTKIKFIYNGLKFSRPVGEQELSTKLFGKIFDLFSFKQASYFLTLHNLYFTFVFCTWSYLSADEK